MRTWFVVFLVSILVGACSGAVEETPTATAIPPTSTPFSTALPEIPTLSPPGLPDNPVKMIIIPEDMDVASDLETTLENEILQASSVSVDVVLASREGESLAALCNSDALNTSVAWLQGLSSYIALSQTCGDPIMRLQTGSARNPVVGTSIHTILNASLGATTLDVLNGRVFCRLNLDDFTSWLYPILLFQTLDVDPANFESINELDSYEDMIEAVASGDCTAASVPSSLIFDLEQAESPLLDDIRTIDVSLEFPYGILLYPPQLPLAARLSLTDGLLSLGANPPMVNAVEIAEANAMMATATAMAEMTQDPDAEATEVTDATETPIPDSDEEDTDGEDDDNSDMPADEISLLEPFFGVDVDIVRFDEDDLTELAEFLESTGFDFTLLGN